MEIRCPSCGKKLGNRVLGLYITDCPRCHNQVRMVMRGAETVTFKGERYEISCRSVQDDMLRTTGVYSRPAGETETAA